MKDLRSFLKLAEPPKPDTNPEPVGKVISNDGDFFDVEWNVKLLPSLKVGTELYAELPKRSPALPEFIEMGGDDETDPLERLRAFCSFAMSNQDWLDVEPFFKSLEQEALRTANEALRRDLNDLRARIAAGIRCAVNLTVTDLNEPAKAIPNATLLLDEVEEK
jgi:hypothetical protein